MLPVVICDPDETVRARWVELLGDLLREEYPSLRTEMLAGADRELARMLELESGIMLVILGVTDSAPDGVEGCISRFRSVMTRNRDSYAVLCVHESAYLDAVLSRCMRPAGILMFPLREEFVRANLRRVLNDYVSLYQSGNEGEYMVVSSGGTVQRIAYRDVLYLEAQNKLLRICLAHHAVTVRESLNVLEASLPGSFVRCHRSYIVNWDYVESFSASEMTLRLKNQELLPVSRSYKSAFRDSFRGMSRV